MTARADRGSASIWVLAGGALLLLVAVVVVLRTTATLARHRAETAADAAALAAAAQIGVSARPCAAAGGIAAANNAILRDCRLTLADDGHSGQVEVTVSVEVDLPLLGADMVQVAARAQRDRGS